MFFTLLMHIINTKYIIKITQVITSFIAFACLSKSGSNLLITSISPILTSGWWENWLNIEILDFKNMLIEVKKKISL